MTDVHRLEASLRTLRAEIATLDTGDDDARRRLASLVGELESAVADPSRSGERRTLGEQLRASILRVEAAHPRLAGLVNEVVESLGNMGI
jgi:outer membrane protein TolC